MRAWFRALFRLGGCSCPEQLLCCDPRCRVVARDMLRYYRSVGDSVSG